MIVKYWPGIRHKVKIKEDSIETVLQKRVLFFFWEDLYPYRFHFELRKDFERQPAAVKLPRITRPNPMLISFHNVMGGWGILEIWDENTFDLKKRLTEIMESYRKSVRCSIHFNYELQRQLDKL